MLVALLDDVMVGQKASNAVVVKVASLADV
jgi:hypothetical protein